VQRLSYRVLISPELPSEKSYDDLVSVFAKIMYSLALPTLSLLFYKPRVRGREKESGTRPFMTKVIRGIHVIMVHLAVLYDLNL